MSEGLTAQLVVSNFARSLRFYTDVMGFTTMRMDPGSRIAELERDGAVVTILESASDGLEYPFGRGTTLTVWTRDADAVYAGAQAYGARLLAPMSEHWRDEETARVGHLAFTVLDPDGYAVRFAQALRPQARK